MGCSFQSFPILFHFISLYFNSILLYFILFYPILFYFILPRPAARTGCPRGAEPGAEPTNPAGRGQQRRASIHSLCGAFGSFTVPEYPIAIEDMGTPGCQFKWAGDTIEDPKTPGCKFKWAADAKLNGLAEIGL